MKFLAKQSEVLITVSVFLAYNKDLSVIEYSKVSRTVTIGTPSWFDWKNRHSHIELYTTRVWSKKVIDLIDIWLINVNLVCVKVEMGPG